MPFRKYVHLLLPELSHFIAEILIKLKPQISVSHLISHVIHRTMYLNFLKPWYEGENVCFVISIHLVPYSKLSFSLSEHLAPLTSTSSGIWFSPEVSIYPNFFHFEGQVWVLRPPKNLVNYCSWGIAASSLLFIHSLWQCTPNMEYTGT